MKTYLMKQLEEKGYTFTGIYEWDKEIAKKKAAELRKEGYRVTIAITPGIRQYGHSIYSKQK